MVKMSDQHYITEISHGNGIESAKDFHKLPPAQTYEYGIGESGKYVC